MCVTFFLEIQICIYILIHLFFGMRENNETLIKFKPDYYKHC